MILCPKFETNEPNFHRIHLARQYLQGTLGPDFLVNTLSLTLKNQSIAVQQLQILTANLEKRIEALEKDMQVLQDRLSSNEARLEIAVKLQLISNLIIRTEQILRDGYGTLEDIIHYSVLGQTSPKVLPLSQIETVQIADYSH